MKRRPTDLPALPDTPPALGHANEGSGSPRFRRRSLLGTGVVAGAGLALGAAASVSAPGPNAAAEETAPAYRFMIEPGRRHQTIEGFGASGSWWSQHLGGWSGSNRARVARLLFSRGQGIGLSQYRYNIGGGIDDTITDPWRTTETYEVSAGVYDWDRDRNARWFLQAARDHGVHDFVAFVNSPPRRLTTNGHTYGTPGAGSNLAPERYEEFTRYLIDIVRHFRDHEGIEFTYISPINEPQWTWDQPGQEGCHYEPEQVAALTRTVIRGFAASGLDTLVSAPEAGSYQSVYADQNYADALLSDPEIRRGLGEFAVHSYWSQDEQRAQAAEKMINYPEQRLTMSEWCEMVGGRDTGMDSALVLARTVHSDLTIANVGSWQLWIAVSRYDYHDGLLYTDYVLPGDRETLQETKRLWALGNYSRFIRPGSARVGLDTEIPNQTDGEPARIPFVTPTIAPDTGPGDVIFRIEDPAGDDNGPGRYTYPGNPVFAPGSFDLLSVEAIDDDEDVLFKIRVGADLHDPWNGSAVGYDIQVFDIYVDKDGPDSGFAELLPGRRALVADDHAWDLAIFATGRTDAAAQNVADKVSDAMRSALFVPLEDRQSVRGDTLTIRVPKSFLGQPQPGWSYQVLVLGAEGNMAEDSLRAREVLEDATDWNFGGGSDGREDPNIIDLLVPDGMTQAEALAFVPATKIEIFGSAYLTENEGTLALVLINEAEQDQQVELSVPHDGPSLRLTPHRTSESDDLRKLDAIRLRQSGAGRAVGTTTLAARSVTTFTASLD